MSAEMHPLYRTMSLVRIVELDRAGRARLEYEAQPGMCHSGGVVQGGFITGWIDAAMAHAAIARFGDGVVPMSLELKVSFFAPARPGLVIAEGWIERAAGPAFAKGTCWRPTGRFSPRRPARSCWLTASGSKAQQRRRWANASDDWARGERPSLLNASAAGQA